jgi:hypothetical protein
MPMVEKPASAFEKLAQKRNELIDQKAKLAEAFDELTENLRAIERVIRILRTLEEED